MRGRDYYKYHDSWNHNKNSCWAFRGVIQNCINMGVLKLSKKKELIEDPFPLVDFINMTTVDLRGVTNELRKLQVQIEVVRRSKGSPQRFSTYGTLLKVPKGPP